MERVERRCGGHGRQRLHRGSDGLKGERGKEPRQPTRLGALVVPRERGTAQFPRKKWQLGGEEDPVTLGSFFLPAWRNGIYTEATGSRSDGSRMG